MELHDFSSCNFKYGKEQQLSYEGLKIYMLGNVGVETVDLMLSYFCLEWKFTIHWLRML